MVGASQTGLALSVYCDRLSTASGGKVQFSHTYVRKKEKPHYVVACGPDTYVNDLRSHKVELDSLNSWKGAIHYERDIPSLCAEACSAAENHAIEEALEHRRPAQQRRISVEASGGGKRASGTGASGSGGKRPKASGGGGASPDMGGGGSDIFGLLRQAMRGDIITRINSNADLRTKVVEYATAVYKAVAMKEPLLVRTESGRSLGMYYNKTVFEVAHIEPVVVALRSLDVAAL